MNKKIITIFSSLILGLIVTVAYQIVVINELTTTMEQQDEFNNQITSIVLQEKMLVINEKLNQEESAQLASVE